MTRWYRLEGRTPVPCKDMHEAARSFEEDDRTVRVTETELHQVSTVFLGLDHRHSPSGPPLLFETMVFGRDEVRDLRNAVDYGGDIGILARYSTWEEAEAGHARVLGEVIRLERKASIPANFHRKTVD